MRAHCLSYKVTRTLNNLIVTTTTGNNWSRPKGRMGSLDLPALINVLDLSDKQDSTHTGIFKITYNNFY